MGTRLATVTLLRDTTNKDTNTGHSTFVESETEARHGVVRKVGKGQRLVDILKF